MLEEDRTMSYNYLSIVPFTNSNRGNGFSLLAGFDVHQLAGRASNMLPPSKPHTLLPVPLSLLPSLVAS